MYSMQIPDANQIITALDELPAQELIRVIKAVDEIKHTLLNLLDVPQAYIAMPEKGYSVILIAPYPGKKIQAIKAVRQVTSVGLKEAKDLVDAAPCIVLHNVTKQEAIHAQLILEAENCNVKITPKI